MRNSSIGLPSSLILLPLCVAASSASCRVVRQPDPSLEPTGRVNFRIENATGSEAEVGVSTGGDADSTAARTILKDVLLSEGTVRVGAGSFSEGELLCTGQIVVTATVGADSGTGVVFEGAGTGTPGFDEGSLGLAGERTLLYATHYDCGDTVVVRITDDGSRTSGEAEPVGQGEITVYAAHEPVPDPDLPTTDQEPAEADDQTESDDDDATASEGQIRVRVENATPTDAQVTISVAEFSQQVGTGSQAGQDQDLTTEAVVRVGADQHSEGTVACGQTVSVAATLGQDSPAQVSFTGDGTGTPGFDEGSVGLNGERLLIYGEHYTCGDTLVVRLMDDGTGVAFSESDVALGEVLVFTSGQTLPDPAGLPEEGIDDRVDIVIVDQTPSPVQIRLGLGTGTSDEGAGGSNGEASAQSGSSEVQVRVLAGGTAQGTVSCSALVTVTASVVIPKLLWGTDADEESVEDKFREVVLTGDGTGTPGFDEGAVGTAYERFLELDTHFSCGDTITITVTDEGMAADWPNDGTLGAGTISVSE